TVTGATGNRDIFTTYDRGLTANQTTTGNVGPFLIGEGYPLNGFLGNGGDVGALQIRASGGPCFAGPDGFHVVTLTGVATDGVTPIDFGGGQTSLTTDLFVIQGHIFDGVVQTPINSTRTTYSRSLAGAGQVEAFAGSTAAATVSVIDGPTVPVGSGRIPSAVALDHSVVTPTDATVAEGINSTAVSVTDASAMPPIVTVTASDATLTAGGTAQFKPSGLNLKLVDFVDISQADFDPADGTLRVVAASGDKRANPVLTVRDLGAMAADGTFTLTTAAPPAVVYVDSAAGGSAAAQVRVIAAVAPAAPSDPLVGDATARTVALSWTDNASNEAGFRIYTVDGAGVRSPLPVATVGANITSATVSGLAVNTTFNFVIEAYNAVGVASSLPVTGSTLALPATPANASFTPSVDVQNRLDVSWDAVADATGYEVYRRTGTTGTFTLVTTVTGTSYADLGRAANTSYAYQIVALRTIAGITDASTAATTAAQTTVASPTSATFRTPATVVSTVAGVTSIAVNWNDRATNEAGYQVYRRTAATATTPAGAFVAVSPVIAAQTGGGTTAANAMVFTDTPVVAGSYQYRVDVRNWAATVQSAVSAAVVVAGPTALNAPTNLTASVNTRPTLNWLDASTGETGYRVKRYIQTVDGTTGQRTDGTPTVFNIAANLQTYRETVANTLATQQTVRYEVLAVDGATEGAAASVFTTTSTLPTAGRPVAAANGAGSLRVTWPATTNAVVGGWELQRCAGATCTNFVKVNGTAVNTIGTVDGRSTVAFNDTGLTSGTTYRYRLFAVGAAGTTFRSATASAISVNRVAP
ncbi:MAG: hypothetical protein RLZZ584_2381, partial [Pseudomonadota bacterium]